MTGSFRKSSAVNKYGIFRVSKINQEKFDLLIYSIDKTVKNNNKTPSLVVDSLIKWAYKYDSIFTNAHQVVASAIKSSGITLKNGYGLGDDEYNRAYLDNKYIGRAIDVLISSFNYGNAIQLLKRAIHSINNSTWYYPVDILNPDNLGKHAKPIDMKTAKFIAKSVKVNISQVIDLLDPHKAFKQALAKEQESKSKTK